MHLVPLLSRLVLAAAFIPAGWGKVMATSTVEGPEAAAIRTMLADPWRLPDDAPDEDDSLAAAAAAAEADTTASEAPLEVRNVLRLAVMLDQHDLPMPVVLAWIAALTELVGGGLLVIGLLSRTWALGLAVAMGVAFALTSVDPLRTAGPFGLGIDAYTKAVAQLGLGTLALGVLLSGPGALAIDHAIFGASRGREVDGFPSDDLDDHDDD